VGPSYLDNRPSAGFCPFHLLINHKESLKPVRMKILIIGASGLIAGPVIRKLDDAGFNLKLFSRSVQASMFSKTFELFQGDLFRPADLETAVSGCDAIHISVSSTDEEKATSAILEVAIKKEIKRISMVSGATVSEENRWFRFTDQKFRAEQLLIQSGIPYYIFRPTWFFESLQLMVRNGKATLLGRQSKSYHWLAAEDFGQMVANAYSGKGAESGIYYAYGPRKKDMRTMLEKYCQAVHPEIEKVSVAPLPLLRTIAFLSGNKSLKYATSLFSYFQKVDEPDLTEEELARLGRPSMDFEVWIDTFKRGQSKP